MFNIIYKVTNLINGKFYIGAHSTTNIDDGYYGSGKAISRAIKKYGKENFKKEILVHTYNKSLLYWLEDIFIDINDKLSYNMKPGGYGGFYGIDTSGNNNCMKNPEIVKKNVESRKIGDEKCPIRVIKRKETAKQNIQKSIEKRIGQKDSKETIEKRTESMLKTIRSREKKYEIISPLGDIYYYSTISECIIYHNLNRNMLFNWRDKGVITPAITTNKITESGKNTYGWEIKTIKSNIKECIS